MLDHLAGTDMNARAGAGALDLRHCCNAGESFAAKAEAGDGIEVRERGHLARRVAHEGERELVRRDPITVVADTDRCPPRSPHVDADSSCFGVDGVLDQLFDNRGGTFDHFTGRDRIRDLGRQDVDGCGHVSSREPSSLRSGSGAISIGRPS